MPQNNNGMLSFISGEMGKIEINTPQGGEVITNASKIHMENVDQVSIGGSIEHNAGDLTQIGGSQTAINGGRIINRVEGGTLYQRDIHRFAANNGEVINEVKKN